MTQATPSWPVLRGGKKGGNEHKKEDGHPSRSWEHRMSYDEAHAWEDRAKREGVSKVARSQRGFMRFYEKFANKEIQDP